MNSLLSRFPLSLLRGVLFLLATQLLLACGEGSKANNGENSTDSTQASGSAQPEDKLQYDRYWNDLARWLGGLKPLPGSKVKELYQLPGYDQHMAFWDKAWQYRDTLLLQKLDAWAADEFQKAHLHTGNVFYPLSGPDFLTIYELFPNARKYIFYGLEPEGRLADSTYLNNLTQEQRQFAVRNLQNSLEDILKMSFFVTREMQRQLKASKMDGQFPIILSFMARHGVEVIRVEPIKLSGSPEPVVSAQPAEFDPEDRDITGLRFVFRQGPGEPLQTVEYWSLDILDTKISSTYPWFVEYLKAHAPTRTYFKAASYLMHWDNYSILRNTTLEISDFILQDDSGIAYRYFDQNVWNIDYYGNYHKPKLDVWGGFQADLKRVFQTNPNVKSIDFGIGYTNQEHNCNLIIARKKNGLFAQPS